MKILIWKNSNLFPGTIGSKEAKQKGSGDFTLDLYGWKKFAVSFDSIYRSRHPNGTVKHSLIVTDGWFPAAHLDFYVGQPLGIRTVAIGPIDDIHQYHWLNRQRSTLPDTTDLYIIIPSNYFFAINKLEVLKNRIPASIDTLIQKRGGKEARRFYVYYFAKDRYPVVENDF